MGMHSQNDGPKAHRGILGPAWRKQLADQASQDGHHRHPGARADRCLRDLCKFQELIGEDGAGLPHAQARFPLIFKALEVQDRPAAVDALKIMVVGGLTYQEIEQRLGLDRAVIETWEAMYFDVRDLRDATTWLAAQVIEPARAEGNFQLANNLRLALGGGPAAVRAILSCQATLPLDEADRLYQRQIRLALKFEQALEIPLTTEENNLKFLKMYMHHQCETERLKVASRKLEQQCDAHRDRHELAKLRLEAAARRAATRAAGSRSSATTGGPAGLDQLVAGPGPLGTGKHAAFLAGVSRLPSAGLAGLRWAAPAPVARAAVPAAADAAAVPSEPDELAPARVLADLEDEPSESVAGDELFWNVDESFEQLAAERLNGRQLAAVAAL